jgi:hypothetical protein
MRQRYSALRKASVCSIYEATGCCPVAPESDCSDEVVLLGLGQISQPIKRPGISDSGTRVIACGKIQGENRSCVIILYGQNCDE